MGKLLRRWVGLAQVHNTALILINQLRNAPKAFAAAYTVGGNAAKFYSHVRVRVGRVEGSKIIDPKTKKMIGMKGYMRCLKNKTGGEEGAEIGFRLYRKGGLEFVPLKEVTARKKGNDDAE